MNLPLTDAKILQLRSSIIRLQLQMNLCMKLNCSKLVMLVNRIMIAKNFRNNNKIQMNSKKRNLSQYRIAVCQIQTLNQ
jgi:hypothetical protein